LSFGLTCNKKPNPFSNDFVKKTSRSHHSSLSELNITPLLDLVFVLLVIFIITTPQMMNNLEMTLPSGKPPPKTNQPKPKINKIVVDAQGRTFLNDQFVTIPQLKDKLEQLQADNPDLSVVVKGADAVDYQNMIYVLDVLRQLDITKVGLATEEVASP
jgi:biopolymer transport protein ExbD